MQVKVNWAGESIFIGQSGSGHQVVMDGPPEGGGRNLGVRPMEMLLLGMAACSSYDVVSILKKSRQSIQQCSAQVTAKRAQDDPKVFTEIDICFVLIGHDVVEERVSHAIELSMEKYCSASIMLAATANITHSYKIIASDET